MERVKNALLTIWQTIKSEWDGLDWSSLRFDRYDETILVIIGLVLLIVLALFVGYSKRGSPGRRFILLPGIIPSFRSSPLASVRHIPATLFLVGLVIFFIAFADPYLNFVREEVTARGQKIAILVDASGSMDANFRVDKLAVKDQKIFYTAIAAAESFVKLRMDRGQKDLVSLVLFGNEAYVITPFTPDYQNILTSISLMGEPQEYARFPDKSTTIARAMSQATQLFKTFGFVGSSGNAIVLFSDGEDGQVIWEGLTLSQILASAQEGKIPVYFIRTRDASFAGHYVVLDEQWRKAAEATGGKFYLADYESSIIRAVKDIDEKIKGEIKTTRYAAKRPYFLLFLISAFVVWTVASILASSRFFSKFP